MSLVAYALMNEGKSNGTELILFEDTKGRYIIGKLEVVTELDETSFPVITGYVLHDPVTITPVSGKMPWMEWKYLRFPFGITQVDVHPDELRYTSLDLIPAIVEKSYRRAISDADFSDQGQVAKGLQMN